MNSSDETISQDLEVGATPSMPVSWLLLSKISIQKAPRKTYVVQLFVFVFVFGGGLKNK
jgi:hypothetical protein